MSGFLDRILSGQYPRMESLWRAEFEKMVDEVFGRADVPRQHDDVGGLEDEFDETYVESELNTTIEALQADLRRVEQKLVEERTRHEAAKRELHVTKSELKAARYKLDAVQSALDRAGKGFHGEPVG